MASPSRRIGNNGPKVMFEVATGKTGRSGGGVEMGAPASVWPARDLWARIGQCAVEQQRPACGRAYAARRAEPRAMIPADGMATSS